MLVKGLLGHSLSHIRHIDMEIAFEKKRLIKGLFCYCFMKWKIGIRCLNGKCSLVAASLKCAVSESCSFLLLTLSPRLRLRWSFQKCGA